MPDCSCSLTRYKKIVRHRMQLEPFNYLFCEAVEASNNRSSPITVIHEYGRASHLLHACFQVSQVYVQHDNYPSLQFINTKWKILCKIFVEHPHFSTWCWPSKHQIRTSIKVTLNHLPRNTMPIIMKQGRFILLNFFMAVVNYIFQVPLPDASMNSMCASPPRVLDLVLACSEPGCFIRKNTINAVLDNTLGCQSLYCSASLFPIVSVYKQLNWLE